VAREARHDAPSELSRACDAPMMDRHPDGSLRVELTDGNSLRVRTVADGRTAVSVFGPAGGHRTTIRLTGTELQDVIAALATSAVAHGPTHGYRDAMTP
jgi:hypothetical protein